MVDVTCMTAFVGASNVISMVLSICQLAEWFKTLLLFCTECDHHEDMDVDLDRAFLQDLRELKLLTDKQHLDEHKMLVDYIIR